MRVVQVSCFQDPLCRAPELLLDAWPTLVDVATATAAPDVEVVVVQAAAEEREIVRDGARFVFVRERVPGRARRALGLWATPATTRVMDVTSSLRPDLIHFHSLSFPVHIRKLNLRMPRSAVLVQDHADHPPPGWRRPIHRYGLARIDAVAFTAREQAAPFIAAGVLGPGVRVIEIPESSTRFTPGDVGEARAATGLHGDPCLLWLGHLDDNKDPLCVLDALARSVPHLVDPQLWCCFLSAPLLDQVRARIAGDPVLRNRVHLLGAQPHERVETLLRAADFLVQGSHVEGSGYAVIEALACGTTPLVTNIPSFRTLTAGGRYGALSPPGDAAAMARALIEWATRDRNALRAAAREHFERALSFAALGARLREAYAEVLA